MTRAQRSALEALAMAGGDMNWLGLKSLHPWTRGSILARGWVEVFNDPHRDEVWAITDAGRNALANEQEVNK